MRKFIAIVTLASILLCGCGKKAIVNARIDWQGNVITEGGQILLGGNDAYLAMCHSCWRKKIAEQKLTKE